MLTYKLNKLVKNKIPTNQLISSYLDFLIFIVKCKLFYIWKWREWKFSTKQCAWCNVLSVEPGFKFIRKIFALLKFRDIGICFPYAVRLGSNPADAAMARLIQGTKVVTQGGHDKVFQNTFGILQGEKLVKQYACYLSTSTGPIIGTLYISTKRLAFCSDFPLYHHNPFSLQSQPIYYKVAVILLFSFHKLKVFFCLLSF